MGPKSKKIIALFIAVALLAGSGLVVKKIISSRPVKQPKVAKTPVETERVKEGAISSRLNYSGTVVSKSDAVIAARIMGRITSLPVREGDVVKEGDLLCAIDDSEYTGKINTLRQRAHTAELNFRFLDQQLAKYKELYQAGALSEHSYLQYQLQRDTAASQTEEARFAVREIEVAMENAYIKAPFNGIVSSLQSRQGDLATVGRPILTLSDTSGLNAQVRVTEGDLKAVREGLEVVLTSPLLPEKVNSRVAKIYPSADPQGHTTTVEIPVTGAALKPGASVDAMFLTGGREKAVVVPAASVRQEKSGSSVFVVVDGRAVQRNVTTGIKGDGLVEITGGLTPGEEIVVSDLSRLTDGREVYVFKGESGSK